MRALVQRCLQAQVQVEGEVIAAIDAGLLILLGVTHGDDQTRARELARKVHELRIFRDDTSLATDPGPLHRAVLVVSQFTLYADTRKGRRPSWSAAAPGPVAAPLVDEFVTELRRRATIVKTGRFGADMQVTSINDGPVTLLLEL